MESGGGKAGSLPITISQLSQVNGNLQMPTSRRLCGMYVHVTSARTTHATQPGGADVTQPSYTLSLHGAATEQNEGSGALVIARRAGHAPLWGDWSDARTAARPSRSPPDLSL